MIYFFGYLIGAVFVLAFMRGTGAKLRRLWIWLILIPCVAGTAYTWRSLTAGYTSTRTPPYTREQLEQARQYVRAVVSVGAQNKHAVALGFQPEVVDGRIMDYCGRKPSLACVADAGDGGVIYLTPAAGKSVVWHEIGHIRDYWIEGKPWEDTVAHIGWQRRY